MTGINSFLFNLDTEFLQVSVEEAQAIAEITLGKDVEAPEKFYTCLAATEKMLRGEPIDKIEFMAIMDVIGGYFVATESLYSKGKAEEDVMDHARELMRFTKVMMEIVRPVWGLSIVK